MRCLTTKLCHNKRLTNLISSKKKTDKITVLPLEMFSSKMGTLKILMSPPQSVLQPISSRVKK
jgi:hypothetical protein